MELTLIVFIMIYTTPILTKADPNNQKKYYKRSASHCCQRSHIIFSSRFQTLKTKIIFAKERIGGEELSPFINGDRMIYVEPHVQRVSYTSVTTCIIHFINCHPLHKGTRPAVIVRFAFPRQRELVWNKHP